MVEPGKIEGLVARLDSMASDAEFVSDGQALTEAATALTALRDELEQVRGAIAMPTPAAIAAALPLTNEPDDDDWRIADEACEMLACVNTDGELAAAQLCRDYRNVADFLARAALSRDPKQ